MRVAVQSPMFLYGNIDVNYNGYSIEFVRQFLETEGFPVLNTDVGGEQPRHVHFHTDSGRAFVKRVAGSAQLVQREQRSMRTPPAYGDVTLFD